jgi:hypothetical protein
VLGSLQQGACIALGLPAASCIYVLEVLKLAKRLLPTSLCMVLPACMLRPASQLQYCISMHSPHGSMLPHCCPHAVYVHTCVPLPALQADLRVHAVPVCGARV